METQTISIATAFAQGKDSRAEKNPVNLYGQRDGECWRFESQDQLYAAWYRGNQGFKS